MLPCASQHHTITAAAKLAVTGTGTCTRTMYIHNTLHPLFGRLSQGSEYRACARSTDMQCNLHPPRWRTKSGLERCSVGLQNAKQNRPQLPLPWDGAWALRYSASTTVTGVGIALYGRVTEGSWSMAGAPDRHGTRHARIAAAITLAVSPTPRSGRPEPISANAIMFRVRTRQEGRGSFRRTTARCHDCLSTPSIDHPPSPLRQRSCCGS